MSIFCISLLELEKFENTVTEQKEGLVFFVLCSQSKKTMATTS